MNYAEIDRLKGLTRINENNLGISIIFHIFASNLN